MLISELPVEILFQILSKVSLKDDIYECMNVCRLWREKLAPVCYKNIIIHRNHVSFLRYTQKKILCTGERIGDLVKTLTFGEESHKLAQLLSREKFEILIDTLPSLQAIRFHRSDIHKTVEYMQFLNKIAGRTKLQEVSITGWVPEPSAFAKACHSYYSINNRIKHQITTLVFADTKVKFRDSQDIFDYIKEFDNLQHLTVYNLDSPEGFREDLDFISVLNACGDNLKSLKLDSSSLNYITGDHKHHYNLTSLTLHLPGLSVDHFKYMIEYVPNLKELDIICGSGHIIKNVYASFDVSMSFRFAQYTKQLHRFRLYTSTYGESSMDVFWPTMQRIYNNQTFSNLIMTFDDQYLQYKSIYFDKQTFNVECDYYIEHFNGVARGFQFLPLNSITVYFSVRSPRSTHDIRGAPTMSDLLDFAVSQQHVQAYFVMDEQQVVFCKKPVVYPYRLVPDFPKGRSPVQYVYLAEVHLDNDLLDKISNYYPAIKDLKLVNCRIRKQEGLYVVDLTKFRNLQDVLFEFELIQKQNSSILFQWVNDGEENCYIYDRSISEYAMYSAKLNENLANDIPHIIKISTAEVHRLVFQLCGKEIEILESTPKSPLESLTKSKTRKSLLYGLFRACKEKILSHKKSNNKFRLDK